MRSPGEAVSPRHCGAASGPHRAVQGQGGSRSSVSAESRPAGGGNVASVSLASPLLPTKLGLSFKMCVFGGAGSQCHLPLGALHQWPLGTVPCLQRPPRGLRGCQGSLLPLLPPTTPARGTRALPKACALACAPDDTITAHSTPYVLCPPNPSPSPQGSVKVTRARSPCGRPTTPTVHPHIAPSLTLL